MYECKRKYINNGVKMHKCVRTLYINVRVQIYACEGRLCVCENGECAYL